MSPSQQRRNEAPKSKERMPRADRKQQLLAHAKELFVTLGYLQTTTGKIAQAAGVSEPVLYRHFTSKKALFLEVLQEIRATAIQRWNTQTAHLTDPLVKLHAIADMYLDTTQQQAFELRLMHRALIESDDAEIAALLRSFYLESEALLVQVIREGQHMGVFRRQLDPRIGAWELLRGALGYTLTLSLDIPLYREPDFLPHAVECMLQCLIKTDV